MDLLGVIFFSLVFGAALTLIREERARPLVRVLDAVGEAIVKIIDLAMRLAPYGVFGLIFFTTSRFGWGLLRQLGLYVAIVLAGLLVHGAVSLSLLVRSEEHTSELQSLAYLVCRLLLEKKKTQRGAC